MALIRLDDVEFSYDATPVLRGVDLVVPENCVTVLIGPSGSGKSTVVRLIAGFEPPKRGRLSIGDQMVSAEGHIIRPPEARSAAVVFQDRALWPHMTVAETLKFVLAKDVRRDEADRRIRETIMAVGLERLIDARPAQLSGGERQRLAIARALVTRPRILLMDEPLANLDPPLRLGLLEEIRQLQQQLGLTILYVTHNQQETFALGDHAAVIREGRIEQAGSPRELYERPRTGFVASFLGRCALLSGRVREGRVETSLGVLSAVAHGATSGPEVAVVIRPEDVSVDESGPFSGHAARVIYHGGSFEAEISGPDWRVWAMMRQQPTRGAPLRFAIKKAVTVSP